LGAGGREVRRLAIRRAEELEHVLGSTARAPLASSRPEPPATRPSVSTSLDHRSLRAAGAGMVQRDSSGPFGRRARPYGSLRKKGVTGMTVT
ncbi:MAG: hypothetical protein ACRDG9_15530, partial [Actinomycetota bacterium]